MPNNRRLAYVYDTVLAQGKQISVGAARITATKRRLRLYGVRCAAAFAKSAICPKLQHFLNVINWKKHFSLDHFDSFLLKNQISSDLNQVDLIITVRNSKIVPKFNCWCHHDMNATTETSELNRIPGMDVTFHWISLLQELRVGTGH